MRGPLRRASERATPDRRAFEREMTAEERAQPATRGEVADLALIRKRATEHALAKVEVILAALLLATVALGIISFATKSSVVRQNSDRIAEIQQGRASSSKVSCGLNTAVLQTNRLTLEGSTQKFTPEQERGLERLGFGSKEQRDAQQHQQGAAYVKGVQDKIETYVGKGTKAGKRAREVVNPDGSINCAHLQDIGKIP